MTDFGLNAEGFVLKRLADIKADTVTALSTVTDPTTGETLNPDLTDENDPLVLIVNGLSDQLSVCWELLQALNNQFDPNLSANAALTGLVQLNGIKRQSGTYGTVVLTCTGTANLIVASGKRVSDLAGTTVFELPLFQFDGSGNATVIGTRTEYDDLVASAGTVVKIMTPVSGWLTVTNALDSVAGSYEETDQLLRARRNDSVSFPARSIVDSMKAGLLDIDGVTFAEPYINSDNTTDSRGIPAKTWGIVIVGGDDDEIASVIFQRSPIYSYYGTTTVDVNGELVDDPYEIKFSRPTEVDVYIDMEVEIINANIYPDDGDDQITAAILTYASSGAYGLGISTSYDQDGYTPGQSVYASELYIPVQTIPGIRIVSLTVGTSSPPGASSVSIDWNEIAAFDAANITITES